MFSWFGKTATPSFSVKGKVVIVTGASSGIGETLVEVLAQYGCKVVLAARRKHELERVASNSLSNTCSPNDYLIVPTDVSKEEDCKQLIEQTITKFGHIDVLINNAGISQTHFLEEYTTLDTYRDIMDINYFGTLYCTYYALPYLKQQAAKTLDGTMIVGVSSVCGKAGVPSRSGYAASKHAVHGFLDSLRIELSLKNNNSSNGSSDNSNNNNNVHVLIVCPGYVKTPIREVASGTQDKINEDDNIMTTNECVEQIINAMEQKQREVMIVSSFLAKMLPFIRTIIPEYVDQMIVRKQKEGRT